MEATLRMSRQLKRYLIFILIIHCLIWAVAEVSFAGKPVRIGILLPQTGMLAEIGENLNRGMQISFEETRAGLESSSQRLELISLDYEGNPALAVTNAQKLIYEENVAVILGVPDTQARVAVSNLAEPLRVPIVSTGPLPYRQQVSNLGRMAFHLGVSSELVGRFATELSKKSNLQIDGSNECLLTFQPHMTEKFSAAVCPSLSMKRDDWERFRERYLSRFNAEPDALAAIGFASMQIVLEVMKGRLDSLKGLNQILGSRTFNTILGPVNFAAANPLPATFRLIAATAENADLNKALAAETKKTDCDKCKKSEECPQGSYKDLIFSEEGVDCCKKTDECPQGSLLYFY